MAPQNQPNVLFIVIDQLRADCLTGELADFVKTPHLDALMAESVTFTNHFTVATPCGPARASLLTGLYAMNHRVVRNGTPLDARHTNIALEVRKAGYDPLLLGYTDTAADPRGLPADDPALKEYEGVMPGFRETLPMRFDTYSDWPSYLKEKGYDLPEGYRALYEPVLQNGNSSPITNPAFYRAEDSDTAFLTDRTIAKLNQWSDVPWFGHITYIRPHPPFVAPAPYNDLYAPDDCPRPHVSNDVEEERASHPYYDALFAKPYPRRLYYGFDGDLARVSAQDHQEMRAIYFGLITEVDAHIGRLVAWLKETGTYDETLIVVTSDHGEILGDHHHWYKESPYDGSFHIPLIIRDPSRRQAAGQQIDLFTESVDVTPTILNCLGLEIPVAMDGRSLVPFLEGNKPTSWRSHIFFEHDFGNLSDEFFEGFLNLTSDQCSFAVLRTQTHKYVHFNGGLPPMLYDLVADPGEFTNLAGESNHRDIELEMMRKLMDHRMTHADRSLTRMQLHPDGLIVKPGPRQNA